MKKVISFLLSAVIILSGLSFAFADNSENLSPSELSAEELAFIEAASDNNDREIRLLAVDVVRATSSTYNIDDVYSLLIALITTQHNGMYEWKVYDSSIYNQINNNFSHYDSTSGTTYDTGAMLWTIRQTLNDIALELVPAAASNIPSIYELISSIDDTLTDIISAIPQPVDYTSALFFHNIGIAQMFDSFKTNNLNYLYSLNNNVSSIVTNTSNIKTNTDNLVVSSDNIKSNTDTLVTNTNTIHNDLGSSGAIASGISSLQSDFNNISWNGLNSYIQYSQDLNGEFLDLPDSNYISVTRGDIYFSFTRPSNIHQNTVYRFVVPLQSSTTSTKNLIKNLSFYNNGNYLYPNFYYSYNQYNSLVIVYVYNLLWYSGNMIIHFDTSITNRVRPLSVTGDYQIYEIQDSYSDYYTVCNWINQNYQANIMSDFKELYASDDLINAKENQQSYEDQVVSDFTGSGSAAAKASDASSAKNISSAVSSGLTSGGSVNNSLSVFNPSGGFWGWFSQENSDLINTLSSHNRLRSSGSGSDWVIDDPYQRNAEELKSILGGDR